MSFDAIELALDRMTDFVAFERLATEVMYLEGWYDIRPLGGPADQGQDASLLKQVWVGGIAPGRSVPSQEPPRSRPPLRSGDRARQAHAPTAGCASGVKRRVDGRDVIVQDGPQGP